MRILLGILSVLGAAAYAGLLFLLIKIGSPTDGAAASTRNSGDILMLYPLIYFAICIWTACMGRRSLLLLVVGGVANLLLIAFAVMLTRAGPNGWIFLPPAVLFGILWVATYASLPAWHLAQPDKGLFLEHDAGGERP